VPRDHVHTARRLGQILRRKPTGVTAGQWNAASTTVLDYLVTRPDTGEPEFALRFTGGGPDTRADRATRAVCDAAGLPLVVIASPTLTAANHGPQIIGYVLDARAFGDGTAYRDIVGRLPDGRTGHVNDLSAVARAAAVDAYATRQLHDPIIRGIRVRWTGGPAEGWAWLQLREGGYVFEKVQIHEHRTTCGVPADRLAEDLAGAAIGERLKHRHTDPPPLVDLAHIDTALRALAARRADLAGGFPYEHLLATT